MQSSIMAENAGNYEKGLVLALLAALVSGVSVFVNGVAVSLANPFAYTALKNVGALAFVAAIALVLAGIRHFRLLSVRQWGMLALIGVIGGGVPFLMFFEGLSLGGAAVSSFIYRSLFLFAGISGYFILKETPSPRDMAAGFVILAGNALLVSGTAAFGIGQMLVLGATVLWAVEYALSRRLMADVHPQAVMASRMFFGSIVIFGFLAATGSLGALFTINAAVMGWLVLTALLLGGFLFCWYNALKNLSLLKASVIFTLGGIVTAALNLAFLGTAVTLVQAAGLVLILGGVLLAVGAASFARSWLRLPQALTWLAE
jgi:drug/metabolite transporter (DMT)-like permease